MVNLLLLIVMIAALCGMVFCNRKQRKDAKFQAVALGLLVIVIASGGMFMCRQDTLSMLGLSENSQPDAAEHKLHAAQGYVVANFIKSSYPGKRKVLLISPEGYSAFAMSLLGQMHESQVGALVQETLQFNTAGSDSKLITPATDRSRETLMIDNAIARHPDAQVVVLLGMSPSGESLRRLGVYRKNYSERPRLIVIGLTNLDSWAANQLSTGMFDALVVTDLTKAVHGIAELPENPVELFNSRYVLVTRDNLHRNRRFFH